MKKKEAKAVNGCGSMTLNKVVGGKVVTSSLTVSNVPGGQVLSQAPLLSEAPPQPQAPPLS